MFTTIKKSFKDIEMPKEENSMAQLKSKAMINSNCGLEALSKLSELKNISAFTIIQLGRDNGLNLQIFKVEPTDLVKVIRPAIFHQKDHFVYVSDKEPMPQGEYTGYVIAEKVSGRVISMGEAKHIMGSKKGGSARFIVPAVLAFIPGVGPALSAAANVGMTQYAKAHHPDQLGKPGKPLDIIQEAGTAYVGAKLGQGALGGGIQGGTAAAPGFLSKASGIASGASQGFGQAGSNLLAHPLDTSGNYLTGAPNASGALNIPSLSKQVAAFGGGTTAPGTAAAGQNAATFGGNAALGIGSTISPGASTATGISPISLGMAGSQNVGGGTPFSLSAPATAKSSGAASNIFSGLVGNAMQGMQQNNAAGYGQSPDLSTTGQGGSYGLPSSNLQGIVPLPMMVPPSGSPYGSGASPTSGTGGGGGTAVGNPTGQQLPSPNISEGQQRNVAPTGAPSSLPDFSTFNSANSGIGGTSLATINNQSPTTPPTDQGFFKSFQNAVTGGVGGGIGSAIGTGLGTGVKNAIGNPYGSAATLAGAAGLASSKPPAPPSTTPLQNYQNIQSSPTVQSIQSGTGPNVLQNLSQQQITSYLNTPIADLQKQFTANNARTINAINLAYDNQRLQLEHAYSQAGQNLQNSSELQDKVSQLEQRRVNDVTLANQELTDQALGQAIQVKQTALSGALQQGQWNQQLVMDLATAANARQDLQYSIANDDYKSFQQLMGKLLTFSLPQRVQLMPAT